MICQHCAGQRTRLNPALVMEFTDDSVSVENPLGLPITIPCPECNGTGEARKLSTGDRLREAISDVDSAIADLMSCQPMLKSKRWSMLHRFYRIRHTLEILRQSPP